MPTPNDYSNFQFGQSKSAERQEGNLGTAGEYGQVNPTSLNGDVPAEVFPNPYGYGFDSQNRDFSNDKTIEPQAQAEAALNNDGFAELQQFLMNSPYTAGSRVCHEQTSGEKETWRSPHDAAPGAGDGKTGIA